MAIPTANDFIINVVLVNFFLLIDSRYYFRNFAVGKDAAKNFNYKMVWVKTSQYATNRHSSPCSMVSIFLNGACLIFDVTRNVLEKCFFPQEMFWYLLEFYLHLFV